MGRWAQKAAWPPPSLPSALTLVSAGWAAREHAGRPLKLHCQMMNNILVQAWPILRASVFLFAESGNPIPGARALNPILSSPPHAVGGLPILGDLPCNVPTSVCLSLQSQL